MQTLLTGGTLVTPDHLLADHTLIIEGEKIAGIADRTPATPEGAQGIDVSGCYVVPGFIDIHVHGALGSDTMDATPEAIQQIARHGAQHGVTSFLPTTVAASAADILSAIENVSVTPRAADGAQHLGIHLEGPYLNTEFRGAQPPQHVRPADPGEYRTWLESDNVRLITIAPEVSGVSGLISSGKEAGVEFALGHTAASYEQVIATVELGLHQATHTFNGMPGLQHRAPGAIGAVLSDDRIWAQVIVDGVHVHPAVVKLLIRAKGIDRTILVTDAIRATGMPNGDYALGDQLVHVKDGIARTDAGGLAGSTLTMDQALRNVMEFAGLGLAEALPMATRVPAASLRLDTRKGKLSPNFDADVAVLDQAYRVRMTIVAGQVVYRDL